jgi:hypothetical protein
MVLAIGMAAMLMTAGVRSSPSASVPERSMRFVAGSRSEAVRWQRAARAKLFGLLMGGGVPERVALRPEVVRRVASPYAPYVLEEITIQSLPDRRAHLWVASPIGRGVRRPAVLAIHGHGGTGEQIVRGQGLYWYGRALAEMGYVVVAPDVGQHDLQRPAWSLMGERAWDSIRALDYACTRPDVDAKRLGVCGLSLGGETAMYVAALDTRVGAVDSSGWLTTVANMRNGHCACYDFPGLAEHFDFADIFACVAPRRLVFEIGALERAPGGFPLGIAREAFAQVRDAYRAFGAEDRVALTAHQGGHVFVGYDWWPGLRGAIGTPPPWREAGSAEQEAARRGEIAARCFSRAVGVLDGWWAARDVRFGLLPRRIGEPVWAPADNAADLMPFLFLTNHYTGRGDRGALLGLLEAEARLTNRDGVLPDWFSLTTGTWVHPTPDLQRLIFGAAEYCKDGLMPMTEAMGPGPWSDRMFSLLDAIIERAPVETAFGRIPASDTEVNGDVLQVLGRAYAMTGRRSYLDQMARIVDAYCLEVIPRTGGIPAHRWDFRAHKPVADTFNLNDHGNEIVLGLAEAYVAAKRDLPDAAERWKAPLDTMFTRLLGSCRNSDGLWFGQVVATTAAVQNAATPDTWGYAIAGVAAFAEASGNVPMLETASSMLSALRRPRYGLWSGADDYADSIEGAILLSHRFTHNVVDRWLDTVLPVFLARQRDDGIVEGWYGDGNYARTALMVALRMTEGAFCRPWADGLEIGAVRTGGGLRVRLRSQTVWRGKLHLDTDRHRVWLRLPFDYPRLNKWPEWFTVRADAQYRVSGWEGPPRLVSGADLIAGLAIRLRPGRALNLAIAPAADNDGNKGRSGASKIRDAGTPTPADSSQ